MVQHRFMMRLFAIGIQYRQLNAYTTPMQDSVKINNLQTATACVIWLHGLGADGHDFEPVVHALNLPHIHFILPHAPYQKVTLNNGYEMRAWYDIIGLSPNSPQDAAGIQNTQTNLNHLIAEVIATGIPAQRIVLAGFSQGGAIALHTALRYPERLAGVLALSTYLPLKASLSAEKHPANQQAPIFMAHGRFDEVIPLNTCLLSRDLLIEQQYQVHWHEYAMGHSVCPEEIEDIHEFLQKCVPEHPERAGFDTQG
jgi:phospholipase/carboxylesterase